MRTMARWFFLAVAVVCLGVYGYAYLDRVQYQTSASRAFDLAYHAGPAITPSVSKIAPAVRPSQPSSETALIGRISIPRLHLSAMVREGVGGKTLRVAVGHIPDTALPGQDGNVGVAGHRDTFFRGLRELKLQDEIQFTTLDGDFTYAVESLVVVEPDDVGVLDSSSEHVLTLVTCFPFSYVGNAPKRFVVRARQVSPQAPPLTVE